MKYKCHGTEKYIFFDFHFHSRGTRKTNLILYFSFFFFSVGGDVNENNIAEGDDEGVAKGK